MDEFANSDLSRLVGQQTPPCVSIYLPTRLSRANDQQDAVRLRNLLDSAEAQLSETWLRAADARRLLTRAREVSSDTVYWNQRGKGLAIFVAPELFRCYRLPVAFDEVVTVNRRFHVKPLLPLVSGGEQFFVLALSQNNLRLFTASRFSVEQVEVPGLPANIKQALNYSDVDRASQAHTATREHLGKQAAVFHGQGGEPDARKDDISQFFRLIDAAIRPTLRDDATPLLLAGVKYLLPIYRKVSTIKQIAKQELTGNCDYLTPDQLHDKAWPVMEPVFQATRDAAAAKYRQTAGTGKTSDDIRQIVPAACNGSVETLFVSLQDHRWGHYDPDNATVTLHDAPENGDDDLLDLATVKTLLNRGAVYAVTGDLVPSGLDVAAVLRY